MKDRTEPVVKVSILEDGLVDQIKSMIERRSRDLQDEVNDLEIMLSAQDRTIKRLALENLKLREQLEEKE